MFVVVGDRTETPNRLFRFTILYIFGVTSWVRIASKQIDYSKISIQTGALIMKKNLVLAAIFSLCVLALSASAQKAPNFSGTWNLDVSKSKLGDRNNIESQTLTVTQTDTAITVTPATKRKAPPADAPAGGGRMGCGGGGDTPMTYTLDGKEVKTEMQGQQGSMAKRGRNSDGRIVETQPRRRNGYNHKGLYQELDHYKAKMKAGLSARFFLFCESEFLHDL